MLIYGSSSVQAAPEAYVALTPELPLQSALAENVVEDERWLRKKSRHTAYHSYMLQLQRKLQETYADGSKVKEQLVYQVCIAALLWFNLGVRRDQVHELLWPSLPCCFRPIADVCSLPAGGDVV